MSTLGILIPTLVRRREYLRRLLDVLEPQVRRYPNDVGIWKLEDQGVETTGAKRQRLIEQCPAKYLVHVDDDDLVADTYVADIMDAIQTGVDVVGFKVKYYEDGSHTGLSIHSLKNTKWDQVRGSDGLFHYTRTPNHLNPTKREFVLDIGFVNKTVGEDADYSRRLYDKHGAKMTEQFIDKVLYHYYFQNKVLARPAMYDNQGGLKRDAMERIIEEGGSVMLNGRVCTTLAQLDG